MMGGLISRPSVNGEARLRELQHHIALGYVGAKYNGADFPSRVPLYCHKQYKMCTLHTNGDMY